MRLTGTATASKLRISRRTFHDHMARQDAPEKGSDGLWDSLECAAFIINHLGAVAGGRVIEKSDSDDLDSDRELARLRKEQADKLELENEITRGEMLPRAEVVSTWQALVSNSKTKILAIPSKAAPSLVGIESPREVQEKLTKIIHESLAELASTRAIPEGSRRLKAGGRGDGDDGDVGAPAKTDGKRVGRPKKKAKSRGKRRAGTVGHGEG